MNNQPPLHGGGAGFDRERDLEEQRRRAIQDDEISHRERELSDRQHREQYPASAPHHSSASSLPIHQPVASRIPGAISPGGLLANHGNGNSAPHIPLGAPSGPISFGGPLQTETNRSVQHGPQNGSNPQHQMFAPMPHSSVGPNNSILSTTGPSLFGGPLPQELGRPMQQQMPFGSGAPGTHPMPAGSGAVGQGQQPILNDALSYLDQVKVQFADQPDVYNRFLDIMKDFKSQTIDTPGVINRVSELFAGHPNLIQGFNTFLPPGYRIECGANNDPNTIRVTTPQGTTTQSIAGRSSQQDSVPGPAGSNQSAYGPRPNSHWQQPQHGMESPDATFSTPAQNGAAAPFPGGQGQSQSHPYENTSPARATQQQQQQQQAQPAQQQRGVTQPQTSNPVPANPPIPPRNAHTPTPAAPSASGLAAASAAASAAAQQAGAERRGPVEFNHAINYVNKIKNRFHDKPEIYKQFLEILQTYQREQRPITDVHNQVTKLFREAPDLLDDFKQFLPETIPQNKMGPGNIPDEGAAAMASIPIQTPQPPSHSARDGQKMPPVGNFAPPSASKETGKKRPRGNEKQSIAGPSSSAAIAESSIRMTLPTTNKRAKVGAVGKAIAVGSPSIEPTLIPVMPEPLPPTTVSEVTTEEIAFFDRVKKHIGNRGAMNEFFKLCNMYSQGLIGGEELVHKASSFLGSNNDLMAFFRNFVLTGDGTEEDIITNRPKPPTEKVSLSNCRGYGPSYRLLPRQERLRPCSGRDEFCNSVLNDHYASHPTWASEDSGFVAHRKNMFEEGLHRIEEERHDYDFNIEAVQKCIMLLEPIGNQMMNMSQAEMAAFKMPTGLGGPNSSIYKRVFKKIYGEKGIEVCNELFESPFSVLPVVVARMKQKEAEWKFSQREWEKVWAAQTLNMHIKSLDHQGIHVKATDKRQLTAKHLLDVIKTKHEEQRRLAATKGTASKYQFVWKFSDEDVILTFHRLLVVWIIQGGHYASAEKDRLINFFEDFMVRFFNIDADQVQEKTADVPRDDLEEDGDDPLPPELSNNRNRRNGKKSDSLRRGVLDPGRNGSKTRGQGDSAGSGSKETTPDVASGNEEEMPDASADHDDHDVSNDAWIQLGSPGDGSGTPNIDQAFTRPWYNLFCNQTLYLFFYYLDLVCSRLANIKQDKESVSKEIWRSRQAKAAKDIGMPHTSSTYFEEDKPETFWPKTVSLIESFLAGDVEESTYQDILRHYYLKTGWAVYNIQDHFKSICRYAMICASSDGKDKTPDLLNHFLESLQTQETSYKTEIAKRKLAEKYIKDGDLFNICWTPSTREAKCRYILHEESTFFRDDMKADDHFQYYVSSYVGMDPTEGVPQTRLQKACLSRNLPAYADSEDTGLPEKVVMYEGLRPTIHQRNYSLNWRNAGIEYYIFPPRRTVSSSSVNSPPHSNPDLPPVPAAPQKPTQDEIRTQARAFRKQKMREKLVMNNAWMRGLSQDDVQGINENWKKFLGGGNPMPEPPTPAHTGVAAIDTAMEDAPAS